MRIFRCLLGQHPRMRFNRRRRSIVLERYKRAFIRHNKLIYKPHEKRSIHNFLSYHFNNPKYENISESIIKNLHKNLIKRIKRGLKGGSGSRALGASHRGSGSSLNLRRGGKKHNYEEEEEERKHVEEKEEKATVSKTKQKNKSPCDPLSDKPYVNIEVVKHGKDPNNTFSSGTVVKMACGIGYHLNMPENKTAKCVRGKWRPMKPDCLIGKILPSIK